MNSRKKTRRGPSLFRRKKPTILKGLPNRTFKKVYSIEQIQDAYVDYSQMCQFEKIVNEILSGKARVITS